MRTKFPKPAQVPVTGRFGACYAMVAKQATEGKVLLDIGSSAGTLEAKIGRLGLRKIIGVDPNKRAVQFARASVEGARFYVSTADSLPVGDNSVDIACMFDVIEHVPAGGEVAALKEVARVLKKGGIFILTTPNSHWLTNLLDPAWYIGHRHYTPEKIKKFVQAAGMKVKKIEIQGDVWSSLYFIWLYVSKWIGGQTLPRNKWIEAKENRGYGKPGIFTLFLEAQKRSG